MFRVKYGNDYLTDYVKFIKVERGVASENIINSQESASDGVEIISIKRGPKKIPMTFHVIDGLDVNIVRRKLGEILSTSEPKELSFSDEPNYYYNAVLSGEIDYTDDGFFADGGFTLLVRDGVAHNNSRATLNEENSGGINGTIEKQANGDVKLTLINHGTKPVFPRFTITNNHDNGFISIVTPTGVFAMGKPEEADGQDVQRSEVLYDSKSDTEFTKFTSAAGQPHPEWIGAGTDGTIGYQEYNYKSSNGQQRTMTGVKLIDPGPQTGFRGGMTELVLPPDSNGDLGAVNFYAWFRLFTWTTALGQTGVMQILFTDENDEFVAGYGTLKDDKTGNTGTVGFWIGGPNKGQWEHIPYVANNGEQTGLKDNNTMLNDNRGQLDFAKQGATLGFYWKGGHRTKVVPELENVAIHKVKFVFGNCSPNISPKGTMTHMVIRDFWCRKDFVQKWDDLPNRYKTGSILKIDMADGTILKDNIPSATEKLNNSKFFSIPPGESTVEISSSSWNNVAPDVEVSWEEVFL